MSKVTIYGSKLCPDTVEALEKLAKDKVDYAYFDITEDLSCLKAFLKYRDTSAVYDDVRKKGSIGIPLFIVGEGNAQLVTLDMDEAVK